jgi:hypothetical protein
LSLKWELPIIEISRTTGPEAPRLLEPCAPVTEGSSTNTDNVAIKSAFFI